MIGRWLGYAAVLTCVDCLGYEAPNVRCTACDGTGFVPHPSEEKGRCKRHFSGDGPYPTINRDEECTCKPMMPSEEKGNE